MTRGAPPLHGLAVLVVEDRYVVAAELAKILRDLGASVLGPAGTMRRAGELVDQPHDVALLNVDLHGTMVFPLADALMERGTPIAFVTGYEGNLPLAYRQVPRLTKPVEAGPLVATLLSLVASRSTAAA